MKLNDDKFPRVHHARCRVNGSEQTSSKRLSMVFANDRMCNGIWILAGYVVLVL